MVRSTTTANTSGERGRSAALARRAPPRPGPIALPRAYPTVALVLALGLALRAVLLPLTSGIDFKIWDLTVTALLHGQDTYSHTPLPLKSVGPYAYFPLYLYLLAPLKWLALHAGLPYTALGKLPVVAGDVGVALGIGAALGRAGCSERRRAMGMALFFLNPLVLYNGAFYGRFDSLPLAFLLLAWANLTRRARGGRGMGVAFPYALAVTLKTFPIFLLPYALARLGPRRGLRVAAATLFLPIAVSLPYLLHNAGRFLYIVFLYDSAKGPRQFSWQVAFLDMGMSERTATIISYGLLALFALALVAPLLPLAPTLLRVGLLAGGASGAAARPSSREVSRRAVPSVIPPPLMQNLPVRGAPTPSPPRGGGERALADPYAYVAVAYTLFLLLSKVVYEQYLLWPLPFLIILAVRDGARDAYLLLAILSVTGPLANRWIHPFGYAPFPSLWLNAPIAAACIVFVAARYRRWVRSVRD